MSEPKSELEPDYDTECQVCAQKPTVKVIEKDSNHRLVQHTELCGVCCFGEAVCINPEKW